MTLIKQLDELADDLDTVGRPDHSERLRCIIAELRHELPETGVRAAWAAVVDALYEARPDWDEVAGKSSMENAVAAIRSMAAQCSARPAPVIPIAWPEPITGDKLSALVWAQGYLLAKGFENAAEAIAGVEHWLRKHGCDQIR